MPLLGARRTVVTPPSVAVPPVAPAARRLVLVLVDRFDQRAARPVQEAWRIPAAERRALHVATDDDVVWALADAWMTHRPGLPLQMVENDGGVAATVRRAVEYERAAGYDDVVVLVGRVGMRSRLRRLLHDRTADAIGEALTDLSGVATAVMTVAVV